MENEIVFWNYFDRYYEFSILYKVLNYGSSGIELWASS